MNYNTVYVGMDVHKESFTLCSMTIEDEKASHYQKTEADYKKVLNIWSFFVPFTETMLNLYAVMRLVASAIPSIINLCLSMWSVLYSLQVP